jgi:alpha-1,6-mannosyltransferase
VPERSATEPPIRLDYAPPPNNARAARFIIWIAHCCAILIMAGAWLWQLSGQAILNDHHTLITGWAAMGGALYGVALLLHTTPPNALRLDVRASIAFILITSAAMQIAAITLLSPALSDDVARYHAEGGTWMIGDSPYATSPKQYLARQMDGQPRWLVHPVDEVVAHPELPSIYPPIAQLTFVFARHVERFLPSRWWITSGPVLTQFRQIAAMAAWDQSVLSFRIMFALGALIATAVLILILRELKHSVWWSILFAWNPLVIIDTGAMPHVDVVGVAFILLTILMLLKHRSLLAAIMLALACGVKPQAIILLPWLLRDIFTNNPRHARRHVARSLGGFAIACAVIYIPALAYQNGYRGFFHTLSEYSTRWEFNGSIYELIKSTFGDGDAGRAAERAKSAARTLAMSATVLTALLLWKSRATFTEAGYWLFLIGLLFSPVVYPWYLLWMLCFIPLIRGKQGLAGLVWCATVGVSYAVWNLPEWKLPASYALLEYLPVYAFLTVELYFCTRNGLRRPATSAGGGAIFQY